MALVSPANATFNTVDLEIARESLQALGFKVRNSEHMMERHGYLAGEDKARADDINKAFADKSVAAVHAIRGGWGSARLLPHLDFDTIRRNPKVLIGYSDITALLLSIHAKTGLITFHGPIGLGRWDPYSLDYYKRVLFNGEQVTYTNKQGISAERNALTQVEFRTQTITPGKARGRLLGGNLTVLTTILGSPYLPDWDDAILFCEDVHEELYRIDRMLTQLKLAGRARQDQGLRVRRLLGVRARRRQLRRADARRDLQGPHQAAGRAGLAGGDDRPRAAAVDAAGRRAGGDRRRPPRRMTLLEAPVA